jgi:hypothetical protein
VILSELHLLLTYECNLSCAHCFVWGSPGQIGAMSLTTVRRILDQAEALGTIEWIYFEGGEPFLRFGTLLQAVETAAERGFRVGLVTNAFWASGSRQARERLLPLANHVADLSISTDRYHGDADMAKRAQFAFVEAEKLGIPVNRIRVSDPAPAEIAGGESELVFRGRAARQLTEHAPRKPAASFTCCPHEDLEEPGRVHLDPLGWVHICQGITLGNFFQQTLSEMLIDRDVTQHPIVGPLLRGGPVELARAHGVQPGPAYADACHLCYETRCRLRQQFPRQLGPDQMYGGNGR